MIKACHRHQKPTTRGISCAKNHDGKIIEVVTFLCPRCRVEAATQNAIALRRRTISTNIAAYRKAGYRGELPPELRG